MVSFAHGKDIVSVTLHSVIEYFPQFKIGRMHMNNTLKSIMIGTCEIACRYPELSIEDALGDARQLAEIIRRNGIEDAQKEDTILTAACWFISADRDLSPKEAVGKALRLWDLVPA